jgi:hypothetical protein
MPPLYEKPFQSDSEKESSQVSIRMSHPRVRAHVVPAAGKTTDLEKADFMTSFLVAWQPVPTPPPHWVELLREAPFGSQTIRARDLHWDGRYFSIELANESDIEAFGVEMPDWVAFANAEFSRRAHTPADKALAEAQKRAEELESRMRRDTRA